MRKSFFWILILVLSACLTGKQQSSSKSSTTAPVETRISCGPTPADLNTPPGYDGTLAPLFNGLDVHHYPITTKINAAQKYFNQGLILGYGFNHAEAARSFREAARQDPQCAMAYWGLAYVLGPNYNAPMEADVLPAALEAIQQARALMHTASAKERAMIEALAKRYPPSKDVDPNPYYEAYANAMREVHNTFPDDADIAAMAAEAQMDLHPWDLYEKDGTPKPWTPEIVQIIENILAKNPKHPQAAHLYIHATEASSNPEQALAAANMLETRVPGSGHLVHMPSHTYINTGHYHEGVIANERGVLTDSLYVESCHEAGIYPLIYYPHNIHMLAACAAMAGYGEKALKASRFLSQYVERSPLIEVPGISGGVQHFYSIPWFVMVKYAMWDQILMEPAPDPNLKYPSAIWNFAQGMANAAKGTFDKAGQNLKYMRDVGADSSLADMLILGFNPNTEIIRLAEQILQGEILRRQGHYEIAARFFEQAVEIEDGLKYDEPADWLFPARHHLGDVLLKAGRYAEAENVYRTDLKKWKNNGWALMGLYKSLDAQGKSAEANTAMAQFKEAWKHSSVKLESSVL